MIDWQTARRTAARLAKPGPEMTPAQVAEAVEELREGAYRAEGPVREFTGLTAGSGTAPVLVVDRPTWSAANLESFEVLLDPLSRRLAEQTKLGPVGRAVGDRVNGVQVGALLSFLSTRVLGQFDPFWTGGADQGRLLLVAPNVVDVERQLKVDPHDFRLWVCLHEETHRVQFTAVPWMAGHLRSLVGEMIDESRTDPEAVAESLGTALSRLGELARGDSTASLADLLQNERQREIVEQVTGVMSLLEGHADVVMDGVGPSIVPSVATIRRKFDQRRRKGKGGLDGLLRRLLGLDAKLAQYRDGATFVRAVTRRGGQDAFDAVWAEPANLPSQAEIKDPTAWLARVHG
jgi:coenzyme F420 biosynthesis associated uncharacterized protein